MGAVSWSLRAGPWTRPLVDLALLTAFFVVLGMHRVTYPGYGVQNRLGTSLRRAAHGLGGQLDFLPPFRPAAAFWDLFPPLPLPLLFLLRLLPELFPTRLELPSEFAIAAARDLLI